jgi:endonuclease-3
MVAPQRTKPIDKQELCRKLTNLLKKAYHSSPPKHDVPVLETLLFAACHEETDAESAQAMLKRLHGLYPDLNEARVSSIGELQQVFPADDHAPWRAMRIKNLLQYAFDQNYAFELEALRRKTAELAGKQLAKIPGVSWFIRGWSLQHSLGSHVLPLDDRMHGVLAWLGFAEPQADPEQTSESLRPYVRKADAPLFCHLLKCLSLDPKRAKVFPPSGKETDCSATPDEGIHRLEVLLNRGTAAVPKPAPRPQPTPPKTSGKGAKPEGTKGDPKPAEPERVDSPKVAVKTAGAKGEASRVESSKSEGGKPENGKPVSGKAAGKPAPTKPTPSNPVAGKPTLGKPSKEEPARPAASKPAATKAEPAKAEPVKLETPKLESAREGTSRPAAKPASDRKGADKKSTPEKASHDKASHDKASHEKGSGDKVSGERGADVKPTPGKSASKGGATSKPSAAKTPPKPASKTVAVAPAKGVKNGKGKSAKSEERPSGKKRS